MQVIGGFVRKRVVEVVRIVDGCAIEQRESERVHFGKHVTVHVWSGLRQHATHASARVGGVGARAAA